MALIVVTKNGNKWGKGDGTVTPPTAVITSWTEPGAMRIGDSYGLDSRGKKYTGTCRTNTLPIQFDNVV